MWKSILGAASLALGISGAAAMAQEKILISSEWGEVTATLADNDAADALLEMLPLTIDMRDHLRQEKTGFLPSSLPELPRQRGFETGTLGLWSSNHFVIYYSSGSVPNPGIIILGEVTGDVSIFDRPGTITVELTRLD
ncbi:cyclophilin-like fold protein [Yoonia sp.]|uniref:cyclophilin-like fold protein n=1 Tax=Yoonia sp. TaxID=2212373 RepID=UPI00391BF2BA